MKLTVNRKKARFYPDMKRVITRYFMPGIDRAPTIIQKVLELSESEANTALSQVLREFSVRHRNISKVFEAHYDKVKHFIVKLGYKPEEISNYKKLLIGSYFTHEYSVESAALFNPSVVEHPDQSYLKDGQKRIIVSFRATGEGHVSSIVFRQGIIDEHNEIQFCPMGTLIEQPEIAQRHEYDKKIFQRKAIEDGLNVQVVNEVMNDLGEKFLYYELKNLISDLKEQSKMTAEKEAALNHLLSRADSQYDINFSLDTDISERVIFPFTQMESRGIEDARFVRFIDEDGEVTYFATYTAYDGFSIAPQLLKTKDFYHFDISPIHGKGAVNKNFALFPRKIKGKYAMINRLDGINNFIMYSENLTVWNNVEKLQEPKFPWEFIQMGNCGSPIETEDGWLLIMHGVGPMRKYVISASLFDKYDPTKEIGRLNEPLIMPEADEREGYVPNVVYSCGSIIHNGELFIPYAISDYASTFATVNLKDLIKTLKTPY